MVKGYLYTMEVFIVLALLLLSVILVYRDPPTKPDQSFLIIEKQMLTAVEAFKKQEGDYYISKKNDTYIEEVLRDTLLSNIKYDVVICKENCASDFLPDGRDIHVLDIYSSGYTKYTPRKLRVYFWKKY